MNQPNKISVDAAALGQLLQALLGPEHHIRELQHTRSLDDLVVPGGSLNPINVLLAEYRQAQQPQAVEASTTASDSATAKLGKLSWTITQPPNEEIRYNHVTAQTPFGRALITWKDWKDSPSYTVDEAPGCEFAPSLPAFNSLEEAQQAVELFYSARLAEALGKGEPPAATPVSPSPVQTTGYRELDLSSFQPPVCYPTPDPKYVICNNRLCVAATLKAIPLDEPMIMFRGKDRHLPITVRFYLTRITNTEHALAMREREQRVNDWQLNHPADVKEPDTQLPGTYPMPVFAPTQP